MTDLPQTMRATLNRGQCKVFGFNRLHSFALFLVILLLHYSIPLSKIAAKDDSPLINRPAANFYNAQGSAVKVAWSLDRNSIQEDSELAATLTITGVINPREILRPDLKKLVEFQTRFVITDKNDPTPVEGAMEVRFTYLLRPRNRSVDKVPLLEFHFYNSTASDGKKQFPLAIARAVPITVTEVTKREAPTIPLREPEQTFELTTGMQVLEKPHLVAGFWVWSIVCLAGPLIAISWFLAWRRIFPDATQLAKMRQSRAARRAMDAIKRANRNVDPPGAISNAVLGYLRARFPIPHGAVTPFEIEAALNELNVSAEECIRVANFFRACDEARFADQGRNDASLGADAQSLIAYLEVA